MEDFRWDLGDLLQGDRALAQTSQRLQGKTVALLISGGIAAFRTPALVRELRRAGAEVHPLLSSAALHFVTRDALEWTSLHPLIAWFGRARATCGEHRRRVSAGARDVFYD